MKNKTNTTYSSKSATKREQRRHEVAAQKKKKRIMKQIGIIIAACLCVLVIYLIASEIIYRANKTTASSDYSAMLTEDGMFDGIDVNKYVVDKNFEDMVVPEAEITISDEDLDAELQALTEENLELSTDSRFSSVSA